MRKFAPILLSLIAAVLASCGGSNDDVYRPPGAGAGGGATPQPVASISISASQASIANDGSETAAITAFVRDSGNRLLSGVPVTFATDSGSLEIRTAVTGTDGQALAILSTPGNATLRTINVTAAASSATATVNAATTVQVVAPQATAAVGTLTLVSSTPTVPSDSSLSADITAFVRDTSNRVMAGVPVTFTATSGGLTTVTGTTADAGTATAKISAFGDPTNRAITITATARAVTATVNVGVAGTTLTVQGPTSMVLGQRATFQIALNDSGSHGVPSRPVTVTSANGNTLSAANVTTDAQGRATVDLTVASTGNDTITVTGLGLNATQAIAISNDSFALTTPAVEGFEIPLATVQTLTVHWLQAGAPAVGQTVNFSTTRGTLSAASAVTNGSGDASVTVTSSNAGLAVVTATSGTSSTTRTVEFVATTAASIDVQPALFTLAPNEQTTLTAVVRDAANNLVKNKTVNFTIDDVTGGTLSTASAVTNSQGRAQTVYTAGSSISSRDGVHITASVTGGAGTLSNTVNLTVARKQVFITLGTGNTVIQSADDTQYILNYAIQVTDSNGNGVANVPLTVSVLSQQYYKGSRVFAGTWANRDTAGNANYTCADEDVNHNGVLDPGEDFNGSGHIEAGNIALVTPNSVVTDDKGSVAISVIYPQQFAYWVDVVLEARTAVQGTEYSNAQYFSLPGAASDFKDQTTAPPGVVSPFGINVCSIPK